MDNALFCTVLKNKDLLALFAWDETTFLTNTEGSPIRRIGHERWLRNIAVGLGNADFSPAIISALEDKRQTVNDMVGEHINWALAQQHDKQRQKLRKIPLKIQPLHENLGFRGCGVPGALRNHQ